MTTQVAVTSTGTIDFNLLWQRCGSKAGARHEFEKLVEQVVGLQHPGVATVEAAPGDWGIDAFVGDLDGGVVSIWQAKYFIDGFDKSQQGEVRESYRSAKDSAAREGYTINAWTLCVPVALSGPMHKWWSSKQKEWQRNDGVVVELWDEGRLRRLIMQQTPEARAIYASYFNPVFTVSDGTSPEPSSDEGNGTKVVDLEDPSQYDDALFVKQMLAANLVQTRSAREAFYNAEILVQDIHDKGVAQELAQLRAWRKRIDSTWERCFNDVAAVTSGNQLPGVFRAVSDAIDDRHQDEARALRASILHGHGILHQQVDDGVAGWTRDWEGRALEHRGSAPEPSADAGSDLAVTPGEEPTSTRTDLRSADVSRRANASTGTAAAVTDGAAANGSTFASVQVVEEPADTSSDRVSAVEVEGQGNDE